MNHLIPTSDFLLQILLTLVPVVVFLVWVGLAIWLLGRSRWSDRMKDTITRWSLGCIASLLVGLVIAVMWFMWPDMREPAQIPRPTRIDNVQELAQLVFSQYDTGKPLCVLPVTNRANTYLLLLSGTELKAPAQATHMTSDVLAALSLSVFDVFKASAKQALRDFRTPNGQSLDGAHLILAGHSLGGSY